MTIADYREEAMLSDANSPVSVCTSVNIDAFMSLFRERVLS